MFKFNVGETAQVRTVRFLEIEVGDTVRIVGRRCEVTEFEHSPKSTIVQYLVVAGQEPDTVKVWLNEDTIKAPEQHHKLRYLDVGLLRTILPESHELPDKIEEQMAPIRCTCGKEFSNEDDADMHMRYFPTVVGKFTVQHSELGGWTRGKGFNTRVKPTLFGDREQAEKLARDLSSVEEADKITVEG